MSGIIQPGSGVLFMKVGTHADESLESIIERKQKEIDDAGFALWGYGGNTCHPATMVQPFARDFHLRGATIHLVMEPMVSNHFAVIARAEEMSTDGISWSRVPEGINVLGSRYALAIRDLKETSFDLPLAQTRVAVGHSKGRRGDAYIKGRVDKAVLEVTGEDLDDEAGEASARVSPIGLVAEIIDPYAVFLRNFG